MNPRNQKALSDAIKRAIMAAGATPLSLDDVEAIASGMAGFGCLGPATQVLTDMEAIGIASMGEFDPEHHAAVAPMLERIAKGEAPADIRLHGRIFPRGI